MYTITTHGYLPITIPASVILSASSAAATCCTNNKAILQSLILTRVVISCAEKKPSACPCSPIFVSTASYNLEGTLDARHANNLPKTAIMVTATTTLALQKGHAKKTPPKKPHQQRASKTKACYNCHRKRLRCDKSLPSCLKCSINGEECLGYGIVLRWAACNSPTSTTTTRTTNKTNTNTSRTVKSPTTTQASRPSNPPRIITDVTSNYSPHNSISNTTTASIASPTLTEAETIDNLTVETPIDNYADLPPQTPNDNHETSSQMIKRPINFIKIPLTDPILNGLSSKEKWYMHHCKFLPYS